MQLKMKGNGYLQIPHPKGNVGKKNYLCSLQWINEDGQR